MSSALLAAALTACAAFVAVRYPGVLEGVRRRLHASAKRPVCYIAATALLPLILRLASLPWHPVPDPVYHDEFGHLLVADTLASGRLANPPHALWRNLETIYVLQQPTYSSIYPIGQGAVLAMGQILAGSPWFGVLLSVSLMCGAITWMLFGCLPAPWAALGGTIAAFAYGMHPQWLDSYWGGAFCAFGGALFFGALWRLRTAPSSTLGLVAGLGWSLMWLIRPFESVLPFLLATVTVAILAMRDGGRARAWAATAACLLAPQLAAGFVTVLHNRAVTGSFTTLPYRLSQDVYGVPQSLVWQEPVGEPPLRWTELKKMYRWQREMKDRMGRGLPARWISVAEGTWRFFVTTWYGLPVLLIPLLVRDRVVVLASGLVLLALVVSTAYPFFFAHYIAAYTCIVALLIVRGLMLLSAWSIRGTSAGVLIVLFLVLGGCLRSARSLVPGGETSRPARAKVMDGLLAAGGRHLVVVRYGRNHSLHFEWVYNSADVDTSPVVWCRAEDAADEAEVIRYYADRQVWVAEVDRGQVRMSRYAAHATQ